MPRSSLENVVAHWSKLYDGFQTSSNDFYAALEEALNRRQIPSFKTSRVDFSEGGMFAEKREYLRVSRERLHFDVCAAPFGNGFFFSWWLTRQPPSGVILYLLLMVALTDLLVTELGGRFGLGLMQLLISIPASMLLTLFLVAIAGRSGWRGPEEALMTVPLFGTFYERFFMPPTYFRLDSTSMFRAAVHAAVLEVIDDLTSKKGLRCLTEDERKPTFERLL